MQISLPAAVCETVSGAGPRRALIGALARKKRASHVLAWSLKLLWGKTPDKDVLFIFVPFKQLVFCCLMSETAVNSQDMPLLDIA